MRIKLIYPPVFDEISQPAPPISIPSLTTVLRQNGHHVDMDDLLIRIRSHNRNNKNRINLNIFKNKKALSDYLLKNKKNKKFGIALNKILSFTNYNGYDLIGFGALSRFQFLFALLLAKKIKEQMNTPIVIGGCHLIWINPKIYKKMGFVDYLIVGGGELALLRLTEYLKKKNKIKNIPGLVYRKNGKIHQNKPENMSLENIPVLDFDGLPIHLYKQFRNNLTSASYQISQGCPYKCNFCGRPMNDYDVKSIDKVVRELKTLSQNYGITHFDIVDLTINVDRQYLNSLCDKIIKEKLDITWWAFARINNLDKALLIKMKKAGCKLLKFGVESGSDRLLKLMNKGITAKLSSEVLKNSHNAGIKNLIYLIAGFPYEIKDDLKATANFIKENAENIDMITVTSFRVSGNSNIQRKPEAFGIKNIKEDPLFGELEFQYANKISKYQSYEAIFLAYFKYLLRKKYTLLKFVPVFLVKLVLKAKLIKYKRRQLKIVPNAFPKLIIRKLW